MRNPGIHGPWTIGFGVPSGTHPNFKNMGSSGFRPYFFFVPTPDLNQDILIDEHKQFFRVPVLPTIIVKVLKKWTLQI